MSEATITGLVLAAAVALFLWDRLPVAIVATGIALSVRDRGPRLAGFGDPTVTSPRSFSSVKRPTMQRE
jgi:hypothetical protein